VASTVIWVGDLLVAVDALGPANDATFDAIAGLLGLERAETPMIQPPPAAEQTPETPATEVPSSASAPPVSSFTVDELPAIAPRVAPSEPSTAVPPLRLISDVSYSPPNPDPLFSPLAGLFIAQELVTSSRFGPDPDVERLVGTLARAEIPQPVPWQEHRTLARGAQVLVDDAEGMEPFSRDQQGLVYLLRHLVGDALIDVRTIHEAPDPADPVDPWEPPPPGTPVLALTDLGLARRAERGAADLAAAWQSAAAILAQRGSGLLALVPYPPRRWPASLTTSMRLVFWDRSTTTGRARQARRAGPR